MSDVNEAVADNDELPDDLRVPGDEDPEKIMGPGFDLEAHNAKAAEQLGEAPAEAAQEPEQPTASEPQAAEPVAAQPEAPQTAS